MPLGLFSGSSSKPQILPSQKEGGAKHKADKRDSVDNGRGTMLKLEKHVVTIEKKLAEGGFAIVYLVSDHKNRQFALKRQFVNDDPQQIDACKRECLILHSLRGHKNIVQYVDHLISRGKTGVYDCMLLTAYYKNSVLHQMNACLSEGRHFSSKEILAVFCDMCEAVARLHHSTTPLIHRDLKVENILVDERNRAAPPIFVLCDFGSATTRILSTATHELSVIKQEVERYTTLSHRAPEMVDLYSQKPIGTAADIWAMGVMLYKLSYFTLPFGESAMAIQNGAFSFPSTPVIPAPVRAIIKVLLTQDCDVRPNIYQASSLSFEAAGKQCPVHNVNKAATIPLSRALAHLDGVPLDSPSSSNPPSKPMDDSCTSSSLVTTADDSPLPPLPSHPTSTSVNPRLRPKPTNSVPRMPLLAASSPQLQRVPSEVLSATALTPSAIEDSKVGTAAPVQNIPAIETLTINDKQECDGGANERTKDDERNGTHTSSAPTAKGHTRNQSDGGTLAKSAFRPYSETASTSTTALPSTEILPPPPQTQSVSSTSVLISSSDDSTWNAFTDAPLEAGPWTADPEDDEVDWSDPFRSAPFDPLSLIKAKERSKIDKVAKEVVEVESDADEQRLLNRRSFSYEHIDGVGDDASSDSRGRTDGDTTEEGTGKDEEDGDVASTDGGETTDGGTMDDVSGNRPLLDDDELDELEQDEEEDAAPPPVVNNHHSTTPILGPSSHVIPPSPLPSSIPAVPSASTVTTQPTVPPPSVVPAPKMSTNPFNPFLVYEREETPIMHARPPPQRAAPVGLPPSLPMGMEPPVSIISLNENILPTTRTSPSYTSSRAPATLPRQATSLAAAPRPPPSFTAPPPPDAILSLHNPPLPPPTDPRPASPPSPVDKVTFTLVSENRQCHSSMQYEKMDSESDEDAVQTDDSGAGMCSHGGKKEKETKKEGKKKKKEEKDEKKRRDTDGGVPKMNRPAAKRSSQSKSSSQKALNASFVNVSFQSEDVDRF